MKMTFRWYGPTDTITLDKIKQIPGVTGVVTAIYDIPVGEPWSLNTILSLKKTVNDAGLEMEVIESVPVHEDIKLGLPSRDKYISAYKETIKNLGIAGVKCVCYNFMPVFDWLRTNLHHENSDGSYSLRYDHEELMKLDPKCLHLPGWDESYSVEELNSLLDAYKNVDENKLLDNLVYFLNAIMPACDEAGISMAIHPDDPPWSMFNLPRIITSESSYDKLFSLVPNKHNGITFCTGSLGAKRNNDLIKMAKKYANRIYFAHLRQLKFDGNLNFNEAGHMTEMGDLDIYGIVKALVTNGFTGYVRPDHGRDIWGENSKPGYGLYDRALGACYLTGLFEAISKDMEE